MNSDCSSCVHYHYEYDTNWTECTHSDWDFESPDHCPIGGAYPVADAKADAKYSHLDRY